MNVRLNHKGPVGFIRKSSVLWSVHRVLSWRGGGAAQGDRPRLAKGPITETQSVASEGTMCSVDAPTADTHRISPL